MTTTKTCSHDLRVLTDLPGWVESGTVSFEHCTYCADDLPDEAYIAIRQRRDPERCRCTWKSGDIDWDTFQPKPGAAINTASCRIHRKPAT